MVVASEAHRTFFFRLALRACEEVFEGDAGEGKGIADACAHTAAGAKFHVDVGCAAFKGKGTCGAYRLTPRAA